ncbi:hypothetical protein WJX72_003587 [[Myrmecia] bisecta]|uniref:Uncharacterized protein n=1 Tax=[Myrmecia] bisecta TaxID=41462 RepID=A0AAW1QAB1_9CHLO
MRCLESCHLSSSCSYVSILLAQTMKAGGQATVGRRTLCRRSGGGLPCLRPPACGWILHGFAFLTTATCSRDSQTWQGCN